jgi:hypothetical protein
MTRNERITELQELKRACPERIIALYRSAAHLGEREEVPQDVSFADMIESIINHEAAVGSLCDAARLKHEMSRG